jgi:hypothetical protein
MVVFIITGIGETEETITIYVPAAIFPISNPHESPSSIPYIDSIGHRDDISIRSWLMTRYVL